MLCLQNYDIDLQYKEIHIADALSRAYPKNSVPNVEEQSEFYHQVEDIVLTEYLPISSDSLRQFCDETAKDQSLQTLMQVVLTGWPDGLLFKSNQVIILASLRHQIIQRIHSSHMGIEGSLCRAREAYYWPLMNAEIKDFVAKCSISNTLRPEQCHEELNPHELPTRPWYKVGTGLFTFNGKNYIVTVDFFYYSNFIEINGLNSTTQGNDWDSQEQFTRHGIPNILVLDSGPQYSSDEFQQFVNHKKSLMFKYSRMQREIPSRLVCGSHGTCLDSLLLGASLSYRWAGIFSAFGLFSST